MNPSEKKLIYQAKDGFKVKDILVYSDPSKLKAVLNPTRWKILKLLATSPMYPSQIATKLNLHEQIIYYHINQLKKSGLIEVEREERKRGGVAVYYRTSFPAFGIELDFGESTFPYPLKSSVPQVAKEFFKEFMENDSFNGYFVVGSPEPHGPHARYARDGHYAAHLAMFISKLCSTWKGFVVKLDVDIKAEKEEGNNLILIGGPAANLITAEVNKYLPIRFDERNYWLGIRDKSGNVYDDDKDGLIAKIENPWKKGKSIVVLAGLRSIGTKACVIGVTDYPEKVFRDYKGEKNWAIAIRGYDADGDGKIDSVKILR